MKKILSLIMAAAVLVSAAGCSNYDGNQSNSSSSSSRNESSNSISSNVDNMANNIKDNVEDMNPMKRKAEDGTYRGAFVNPAEMDVTFVVKNNRFQEITFNTKDYPNGAAMENYRGIADYLIGKEINDIKSVYEPWDILPDMDKNKIEGGKLVSALNDGLNRGVYKPYGAEENGNLSSVPNEKPDASASSNESKENSASSENKK